jgi:hypothetical protein
VFFNINILLVLLGVIGTILFFFYIGDFFYYLNNKIIFFSIFYLLISGYVTNLFYSLTLGRVAVVLQILASIGLAVFFAKEKFSERIFLFYLILFFIFICYKIFYVQLDTNDIFQHSSKNAISTVALIYTVQYYSLAIKNRVPIRLYPSIFCLFLCVVGIGRTGIFVSFCLFLYILIKNIEFSKFYRIIIFLFIIICFMIFLHYQKNFYILLNHNNKKKFIR